MASIQKMPEYKNFVFNVEIEGYPNKTVFSQYIDDDESSVSNIIRDISNEVYNFKEKHHFVIIFSMSKGKYYFLTKDVKYLIIYWKYMILSIKHPSLLSFEKCLIEENDILEDVVVKISHYIPEFKNILEKNMYTIVTENTIGIKNSIYNVFNYTRNKTIYIDRDGQTTHNNSTFSVLEDMLLTTDYKRSRIPYISFDAKVFTHPNHIVFCSLDMGYLNGIRRNLQDERLKPIIYDITYNAIINKNKYQNFIMKTLGFENTAIISDALTHFNNAQNPINEYNINLEKYYIIGCYINGIRYDNNCGYSYIVIKKETFNKYLLNMRTELIHSRLRLREK